MLCGLLLLAGCTKTIPLQKEYSGPVPLTVSGDKIRLDLTMRKNDGTAYESNVIAVVQYRTIAENALKKAGYSLDSTAETVIGVTLTAASDKTIFWLDTHAGENLATGMLTLGAACHDSTANVAAKGHVVMRKDGATVVDRDIDMNDSQDDCFGGVSGRPMDQRAVWPLRVYEAAVNKHIASWLQLALNAGR
jgi:hypothetical protein